MISIKKAKLSLVFFLCISVCALNLINCSTKTRGYQESDKTTEMILSQAEVQYWVGEFDKALDEINRYFNICIRIKKKPSLRAFILLPQVYISKNDYLKAKKASRLLLRIDPNFLPNPNNYSPDFVELIIGLKKELSQKVNNSGTSKKK